MSARKPSRPSPLFDAVERSRSDHLDTRALAGVVGLSGYLPLADTTAQERSVANQDVPIFMAHGTGDSVVLPERGIASCRVLQDLGYAVEWHSYPMEHSVCAQEVAELNTWLLRVLAA